MPDEATITKPRTEPGPNGARRAAARLNPDGHWPFLDLVRFAAALLVLFGHARGLYFDSIKDVPHASFATRAFYLLTGLHHEGVVLFFVVSGFLVGGSVWRRIERGGFDARLYLVNRFARIYLVLIPAIVFVIALDGLGEHLFSQTRFYAMRPLFPSGVGYGWTLDQIPCHLAALQGVLCTPLAVDPPLWSLGWEWLFYLAAPVLFAICLLPMRPLLRVIAFVLFWTSFGTLVGFGVGLFWLATWLIGTAASLLALRRPLPVAAGLAGLVLCAASLVASRLSLVPVHVTDAGIGLGIAIALSCYRIANAGFLGGIAARGASFSYSLYLIHLPVAVFAAGLLQRLGWPAMLIAPGPAAYASFALIVVAALGCAMMFARLTEDHTAAVRRFLAGGTSASAQPPLKPGQLASAKSE